MGSGCGIFFARHSSYSSLHKIPGEMECWCGILRQCASSFCHFTVDVYGLGLRGGSLRRRTLDAKIDELHNQRKQCSGVPIRPTVRSVPLETATVGPLADSFEKEYSIVMMNM